MDYYFVLKFASRSFGVKRLELAAAADLVTKLHEVKMKVKHLLQNTVLQLET